MASAEQYAEWLVANKDKQGTPEFETVAKAYKQVRGGGETPAVVEAGKQLNTAPRILGLTARYGLEGLANTAQVGTEPIRYLLDKVTPDSIKSKPLGVMATELADTIGLPSPETPAERVAGEGAKLMAGTGGMAGLAKLASLPGPAWNAMQFIAKNKAAANPVNVGNAAQFLAANPSNQIAAAGGAGAAGQASKEAGGNWYQQLIASLLGGLGGSGTVSAGKSAVNQAKTMMPKFEQDLNIKVNSLLQEAGINPADVSASVRDQLMKDLRSAVATGTLDQNAARRLLDFRMTGTTPTKGMLTQDPVQVTREMNLAKIGANSADAELQGLPLLQNRNNAQLIRNIDNMGAATGDAMTAGRSSINRIEGIDKTAKRGVKSLYEAAKAMPGGTTPLDRKPLVDAIYARLASENKLAFLPKEVSDMLDSISAGQIQRGGQTFDVPFDAKALDNLMTIIARAQRGTQDGNVKASLSAVRDAINATPIAPVKNTFGGNQLVTEQGANFLREQDAQATAVMDALNRARSAARQRFDWQESARPIEAALGGAQPDNFVKRFVIGGTVEDAAALAQVGDRAAIRDAIAAHLKDKALSDASSEVGKFSQAAFNKALKQIGNEKLSLFFSPDEIAMLRANARAASYMQTQPVGSAVNNSNSGALMLGKGYDWLNAVANKFPMGKQLISDPVRSIDIALSQRGVTNVPAALTRNQPGGGLLTDLAIPSIAVGGLLAAP